MILTKALGLVLMVVSAIGYGFRSQYVYEMRLFERISGFYVFLTFFLLIRIILKRSLNVYLYLFEIISLVLLLFVIIFSILYLREIWDLDSSKTKDILIYGCVVWLIDKNANLPCLGVCYDEVAVLLSSALVAVFLIQTTVMLKKTGLFFISGKYELIPTSFLSAFFVGLGILSDSALSITIVALLNIYAIALLLKEARLNA
ncbi:hypothetical protein DRP04_04305 [Archaeoglobales archaeon]|nr:MAG: hypothetical protein DRP04_04305 [Archaeoglobales archaeon]